MNKHTHIASVITQILARADEVCKDSLNGPEISAINIRCNRIKGEPVAYGWATYKGRIYADSRPRELSRPINSPAITPEEYYAEVKPNNGKSNTAQASPMGWDKV